MGYETLAIQLPLTLIGVWYLITGRTIARRPRWQRGRRWLGAFCTTVFPVAGFTSVWVGLQVGHPRFVPWPIGIHPSWYGPLSFVGVTFAYVAVAVRWNRALHAANILRSTA